MSTNYQVTGNEYVSLPTIRESDGAIEGVTFLYMQAKGMLELRGDDALIGPFFALDGQTLAFSPRWERPHHWLPVAKAAAAALALSCEYLCPIGERGFGLRLCASNTGPKAASVTLGLSGEWCKTLHETNETKEISGERQIHASGWNSLFVWEQFCGLPLFALAPITEDNQAFSVGSQGAKWETHHSSYRIWKDVLLEAGQSATLDVFWGIGYEEVAAATSAKEMLRQGFGTLWSRIVAWLAARERPLADAKLSRLLNTNMFFAFFFAAGRTIDTEELCLMTSRSPRYYVSAAYWDRDSLLWAFPAILMADPPFARELLTYVFTRQARNFGVHSRYIDGTVLEPGFELDELCAPVIALERYEQATGDAAFHDQPFVQSALRALLQVLQRRRHPQIALYETFLQPTDDMHNYPYLTYDNALVWRALPALARWLGRPELLAEAENVRAAVYTHLVTETQGQRVFIWSTDLEGHHDIYDEPPGSLQLLAHYGFCEKDDPVWQHTLSLIRSAAYRFSFAGRYIAEIGCEHAPHPWVLSLCNSLLCGYKESALLHLSRTALDNGIACESIDEHTGACVTGAAFATCAGFLAYALDQAMLGGN